MPFVARCLVCGQGSRVPDGALGSVGECPRCGNLFTLAPEEETKKAGRPEREPGPAISLESSKLQVSERKVIAKVFSPGNPSSSKVEPLGLAALFLCGAALLFMFFTPLCRLVIPLAILALPAGLVGFRRARVSKKRQVIPLAASILAGGIFGAAWFWPGLLGPIYQASRTKRMIDPETLQAVPLAGNPGLEKANPDWIDAGKAALRKGKTLARISRVWIGPSENAEPDKETPNSRQFLFVRLHLSQGKNLKNPSRNGPVPKLMDEAGKVYPLIAVKFLNMRGFAREEVHAFTPPSEKKDLRLEIPASWWGGEGFFRFTIPAAMIVRER